MTDFFAIQDITKFNVADFANLNDQEEFTSTQR